MEHNTVSQMRTTGKADLGSLEALEKEIMKEISSNCWRNAAFGARREQREHL